MGIAAQKVQPVIFAISGYYRLSSYMTISHTSNFSFITDRTESGHQHPTSTPLPGGQSHHKYPVSTPVPGGHYARGLIILLSTRIGRIRRIERILSCVP